MEVTQGGEGGVAACVFGWLQLNETDTLSARLEIRCMTASGSA